MKDRIILIAEFDDPAYVNRRWFYESESVLACKYVVRVKKVRGIKGKLTKVKECK